MTHSITSRIMLCFAFLLLLNVTSRAQLIPPDSTILRTTTETGIVVSVKRPADSSMVRGELLIRFRQGVLDYDKLMMTYDEFYGLMRPGRKSQERTLGMPSGGASDSNRGFPVALRKWLFTDTFCLGDSSKNIVRNLTLKEFLFAQGGRCLSRLTAASPLDTASVTRQGDTIPCDLYNWMILSLDTSKNPLVLAYLLMNLFPRQVIYAEPNYKSYVNLSRHPKDDTCGHAHNLMGLPTAWDWEVGIDSIRVGLFDKGMNYLHPDLGGGLGPGMKVPQA